MFDDCSFLIQECRRLPVFSQEDFGALKSARIFITGGTGLFGKWLLGALVYLNDLYDLGIKCDILSRDTVAFCAAMPCLTKHPSLTLLRGDVRTFEFPQGTYTHVIHAATDSSPAGQRNRLQMIDTIVSGTRRVLEFAQSSRAGRVLLISSGAIYGGQPHHIECVSEDHTGAYDSASPSSAYSESKRMAENLGAVYNEIFDMEVVIARGFAFVGPYLPLDFHFAVGNFIRDALESEVITIEGDGSQIRSYLYTADLAAWLLRLLLHGRGGVSYNVGSDAEISIATLAHCVRDELAPGKEIVIERRQQLKGSQRSRYVPCIDLARSELGLDVWTPLILAVRRTAAWYKSWR